MSQEAEPDVEPQCKSSLSSRDSTWTADPAAAYPPGYPRLCTNCFPEADVDEDGRDADFDHREVTDHLIRTTGSNNSNRRMHKPKGVSA